MPERDVGTVIAYSLSKGWTVLMLHLLPEKHKTNCGTDLTDRGVQREGRGVLDGLERRPNPTKGNQTPTHNGQRGVQREGRG